MGQDWEPRQKQTMAELGARRIYLLRSWQKTGRLTDWNVRVAVSEGDENVPANYGPTSALLA